MRVKFAVCAAVSVVVATVFSGGIANAQDPIQVQITAPANGSSLGPGPVVVEGRLSGQSGATTSVVLVVDVSGSTNGFAGDCNGDNRVDGSDNPNGDSGSGTILDCEIIAARSLTDQMIGRTDIEVSVVGFGSAASAADVSPAPGVQLTTSPSADNDRAGGRDLDQVFASLNYGAINQFSSASVGGLTSFRNALDAAESALRSSTASGPEYVLFLSDGEPTSNALSSQLDRFAARGARIQTFGIGTAFSGDPCRGGGPLATMSSRTGGACTTVSDATTLAASLTGSVGVVDTQINVFDSNGQLWQSKPGGASVLGEFRTILSFVPAGEWSVQVVASDRTSNRNGVATSQFTVTRSNGVISDAKTVDEVANASDFTPDHADLLRLYWAFFNRDPDVGGAKYWIGLSEQHSKDVIAAQFAASEEFSNTYGSVTNTRYLEILYDNVLGRIPDQDGFNYWLSLLDSNQLTRGSVVRWVAAGDEFTNRRPYPAPLAPPARDPDPGTPRVVDVTVRHVTSESAQIKFTTDECSGSSYDLRNIYGGGGGYPRFEECWTEHQFLLGSWPFTGGVLTPNTDYTIDLSGVNRNGSNGPARTVSFRTLSENATPRPVISDLKVENVTATSALVTFESDQCTGGTYTVNGVRHHQDGFPTTNQCWLRHFALLGVSPFSPAALVPNQRYTVDVQVSRDSGVTSAVQTISFTTKSN